MTNRERERARLVEAMDVIVSAINNEDYQSGWLMCGVADGDINYEQSQEDRLNDIVSLGYTDDVSMEGLIHTFLKAVSRAKEDGGLYIDGVVGQ